MSAGEKLFFVRHRGRGGVEDLIRGAGGNRPGDRSRVQGVEGEFVFIRVDDAAFGVWGDYREEFGLEGLFHVAGALWGGD